VAIAYGLTAYVLIRMLVYVAVLNTGSAEVWELLSRWSKPLYILMLFGWSLMLWLEEPKRKVSTEMHAMILRTRSIERAQSK
jgi:FtsH-binding integral membrane protein